MLERIRNFGIVAHVDAGKTTLSERILVHTGRKRSAGRVDHGDTSLDHDPREQKQGITITAATVRCEWGGHALHLVDTPGHVDFGIEVERSLRVLDGVVVLLDGVAGVEPQTEGVWTQADRHGLPRVLFVNKLDRPGASFDRCVAEVRERFGVCAMPVALPVGEPLGEAGVDDQNIEGLLDLVSRKLVSWTDDEGRHLVTSEIPESLSALAERARRALVEAVAERDAVLLERLGEAVSADDLRAAIRRVTIAGELVPVLGGSAFRGRGVQPLLDAVVDYLPSPLDRGPQVAGDEVREPSEDAPLAALCFKVVHDDHGALTFVRVYSGVLSKGAKAWRSRDGKLVRVGRLVRLFAADREPIAEVKAGEVAAIVGGDFRTGDTLADPKAPVVLERVVVPEPVVCFAIEPVGPRDRDRLGTALRRLGIEDPSLRVSGDPETGQTLLAGMGTLHLEVSLARLSEHHGVEVRAGRPKVAYRETVRDLVEHEYKLDKQNGGPGQFAKVQLALGPGASGSGLVFTDRIVGGAIPKPFIGAVEKGVRQAMECGPRGFPLVDLEVELVGGGFHSNDSHDRDFEIAGARALVEACALADPTLLEPWMALEVTVPDAHTGEVMGHLSAQRARIKGVEALGGRTRIHAAIPLAESFDLASTLSSLTHGRAVHALTPAHYEPVPASLVESALRAA